MNRGLFSVAALAAILAAAPGAGDRTPSVEAPRYNAGGELLPPANYREWIFLSSGLGMNYGPLADHAGDNPSFDNVFVTPAAYKSFLETGRWPERTMFVLEVRSSESKGSINNGGHFQTGLLGVEAEVKDESRFPVRWAFFALGKGTAPGRQIPVTANCYSCHAEHGAVDNTFVQFYPTLLTVAKAKGTMK